MAHIGSPPQSPQRGGVALGLIGHIGLIGLISLMGEPFSPPPLGRGWGWAFLLPPLLGRGWGWVPDSYSLKNQDSSLLSHENVNLNQRNVLTGLPPKFSMNSRRRLCLYGNPTFKKKTCR